MVGKGGRKEDIPDDGAPRFEAASRAYADDQVWLEFMHGQVCRNSSRDCAYIVHPMKLTFS
jgi:hypothetical protein